MAIVKEPDDITPATMLSRLLRVPRRGLPRASTWRRDLHLSPREIDHLQLSQAGQLAQRRLARGLRLNHPETVALIASQLMERIRDGYEYFDLMSLGKRLLGTRQALHRASVRPRLNTHKLAAPVPSMTLRHYRREDC